MAPFKCYECYDGTLLEKNQCPSCGPGGVAPTTQELAEFRRKLVSPEWQRLLAEGRKHLGIPAEPNPSESQKLLVGLMDDLIEGLLQAQVVASGEGSTFGSPNLGMSWAYWVELHRVAASLASYLGTKSVTEIEGLLLGLFDPRPEHLRPASRRTALDEFGAVLFRLGGLRLSERISSRDWRERMLCTLVQVWRGEVRLDWEDTRVEWNREFPAWAYDSTEAFRKAFERAVARRPNADDH